MGSQRLIWEQAFENMAQPALERYGKAGRAVIAGGGEVFGVGRRCPEGSPPPRPRLECGRLQLRLKVLSFMG